MAKVVKKSAAKKVATKKPVAKKVAAKKPNCKCTPKCKYTKPQKVSVKSVTPVVQTTPKKTFWTKVKEFFGF